MKWERCHVIAEEGVKKGGQIKEVMEVVEVVDVDGTIKKWAMSVEWQFLNAAHPGVGLRTGGKKVPDPTKQ